eukprot:TRINITY_DN14116_c0_g2_i11.p5 TRINITY_DN14116_c0_g2~~TRINITY_DN14116_c0_g2_i11.p5  ORF type:complete len:110 (+),score=40.61 TRINITY_DN14116_c0_g2_i11:1124-1453(+)
MPYIMGLPRFLWRELKKIRTKPEIIREAAILDINKEKCMFGARLPGWAMEDFEPAYRCMQEIMERRMEFAVKEEEDWMTFSLEMRRAFFLSYIRTVSYTHLTLPTNREV